MNPPDGSRRAVRVLSLVPAAVLAILPSVRCPVCLGAYGAVLASLGLGFVMEESYLAPLIVAFLVAGIVAVAWTTKGHGRYGPLALTVAGSAAIAAGRLIWDVPSVMYGGGAAVLAASVWNLWLKRPVRAPLVPISIGKEK